MSLPSPGVAFGTETTKATNWLGYGCGVNPPSAYGASAPLMTVQSEFNAFEQPMKAAVPVYSPFMKSGTFIGATSEIPEASYTAVPYKRPLTVTGDSGWPVPLLDAMQKPTVRY